MVGDDGEFNYSNYLKSCTKRGGLLINTCLLAPFNVHNSILGSLPTNPRMETIGPLPLTPPRAPYERDPDGANELKQGGDTVCSKENVNCNFFLTDFKIAKSGITEPFFCWGK